MQNDTIENLDEFVKVVDAIIFHIKVIKETANMGLIETSLCALEELVPQGDELLGMEYPSLPVRQMVREGLGDYKDIRDKCIQLGIV